MPTQTSPQIAAKQEGGGGGGEHKQNESLHIRVHFAIGVTLHIMSSW